MQASVKSKIFLNKLTVKFDIITWLNKDSTPFYNFYDYDVFHVVRDNRNGSGVVIYV